MIQLDREYESVVLNVKYRTNKEYYNCKKLLRQEMWILNDRMEQAYIEYVNFIEEVKPELSDLYDKMKKSDLEYYEERIERIEYAMDKYNDNYEDYKSKYRMQMHIVNGTLQQYLEDLDD